MLINILAAIIGYYLLINIFGRKFPFLIIAFFQILFAGFWMHISSFFLDSQQSIYSIELMKTIYSIDASTYRMLFFIVFLIPPFIVFNKKRVKYLKELHQKNEDIEYKFLSFDISNIVKVIFSLIVLITFIDLISGPIPLLDGIAKGEYYKFNASFIIKNFYTYSPFISFFIGLFLTINIQRKKTIDYYLIFLYLSMILIFVLLGNKFSQLFTITCYMMIPLSTLYFFSGLKFLKKENFRYLLYMGITSFSLIMTNMVYYFFFTKWSGTVAIAILVNRILIQQAQIFVSTYNRVVELNIFNPEIAFKRVFFDPVYSLDANTSLHYLMYQDIGSNVYTQFEAGGLYTSSLPEILLELFGPYSSILVYFIFSLVLCTFLFVMYKSIIQKRYLTVFFGIFVYHSINMSILGGKLTYFCCGEISQMYLLKIFLFLLAYFFEEYLLKKTNYYST